MTERITSLDRPAKEKNKSLVIVFPDSRTTGVEDVEMSRGFYLEEKFRQTASKLINRYRAYGFASYALTYLDVSDENYSYLYPKQLFDFQIRTKSIFDKWRKKDYQDELLSLIPNYFTRQRLVVGGFHAYDCVANFVAAARISEVKADVDLRLTDKLSFLLISHRARQILPKETINSYRKEDTFHWQSLKRRVNEEIERMQRIFR